MIITPHGTSLEYHRSKNLITIILPQTMWTLTNTVSHVANRKVDVPEDKLVALLNIVELIFGIGEGVSE